jgi:hypothetical protein
MLHSENDYRQYLKITDDAESSSGFTTLARGVCLTKLTICEQLAAWTTASVHAATHGYG